MTKQGKKSIKLRWTISEDSWKHIPVQTAEASGISRYIRIRSGWTDYIWGTSFIWNTEKRFNGGERYNDITGQFLNARKYLFDEEKKLYYHAYDEKRQMIWADKTTGCFPQFLAALHWMVSDGAD